MHANHLQMQRWRTVHQLAVPYPSCTVRLDLVLSIQIQIHHLYIRQQIVCLQLKRGRGSFTHFFACCKVLCQVEQEAVMIKNQHHPAGLIHLKTRRPSAWQVCSRGIDATSVGVLNVSVSRRLLLPWICLIPGGCFDFGLSRSQISPLKFPLNSLSFSLCSYACACVWVHDSVCIIRQLQSSGTTKLS